jgi:hypothetical protein
MKRLTLRKNRSGEAMKRLTLLKTEAMKRLTLHRLASSLHRCQHYISQYRNRQNKQGKTFQDICKGKDDDVFWLGYGNYGNNEYFWKLPLEFIASKR